MTDERHLKKSTPCIWACRKPKSQSKQTRKDLLKEFLVKMHHSQSDDLEDRNKKLMSFKDQIKKISLLNSNFNHNCGSEKKYFSNKRLVFNKSLILSSRKHIPSKNISRRRAKQYNYTDCFGTNTNMSKTNQNNCFNNNLILGNFGVTSQQYWRKVKKKETVVGDLVKFKPASNNSYVDPKNKCSIKTYLDVNIVDESMKKEKKNYSKPLANQKHCRKSIMKPIMETKANISHNLDLKSSYSDYYKYVSNPMKKEKKENKDMDNTLKSNLTHRIQRSHIRTDLIFESNSMNIDKSNFVSTPKINTPLKITSKTSKRLKKRACMVNDVTYNKPKTRNFIDQTHVPMEHVSKSNFREMSDKLVTRDSYTNASYRISTQKKSNYIIDDSINYSLFFHYPLVEFSQFRLEAADKIINVGFKFHVLLDINKNCVKFASSIYSISTFKFDIFNIFEYKAKEKTIKMNHIIIVRNPDVFHSVLENTFRHVAVGRNVENIHVEPNERISEHNLFQPEIMDNSSIYLNYTFEDSWDEVSITNSSSSGTVATKEYKNLSSDNLCKTEDIYGSDIEMEETIEVDCVSNIDNNKMRGDSVEDNFRKILQDQEYAKYIKCFIDEYEVKKLELSCEIFKLSRESAIVYETIQSETLLENDLIENMPIGIFVTFKRIKICPKNKEERKSVCSVEYCETIDPDVAISDTYVKFRHNPSDISIFSTIDYLNYEFKPFSESMPINEPSVCCWEIVSDNYTDPDIDWDNTNKMANQLKLLIISEFSKSINKHVYNFKNINISSNDAILTTQRTFFGFGVAD